ncbi:MAG: NTP transferase domain-containing protein [Gemmatimonadales bacterium]
MTREPIRSELLPVLVLAGRRGGPDDLAAAAGATHRALLDIHGVPMLERVIGVLRTVPSLGRIYLSIDRPDLVEAASELAPLLASGDLVLLPAEPSPSRSVAAGVAAAGTPVFVTTADHALLTREIAEHFLRRAKESGADLAFGLVPATVVRARFPASRRTYVPFREDGYSGANLFLFRTPASGRAAEFWVRAERFRKHPWRLARAFGLGALVLFLARRLSLADAMVRASRRIGARIAAVPLPFAEAAVDVDRIGDLELVRELLAPEAATHG